MRKNEGEVKKAIIVDLDGTLLPHHIKLEKKNATKEEWDALFESTMKVEPNKWCKDLIYAMMSKTQFGQNYVPIYLTARTERYRKLTLSWLNEYMGSHFFQLHMRPNDDWSKSFDFKKETYLHYIKPFWDVLFTIDDDKLVVQMWKEIGVTCLLAPS